MTHPRGVEMCPPHGGHIGPPLLLLLLLFVFCRAALLGDLGLIRRFRRLELRRRFFNLFLMLLLDVGLLSGRFGVALGLRRVQLRLRLVAIRTLSLETLLLDARRLDAASIFLSLSGEQPLLRRLRTLHALDLFAPRAFELLL